MCGREDFILVSKRAKIINISTYKRKRQLRKKRLWTIKNKAWVIIIISAVCLTLTTIWFFNGDPSSSISNPDQITKEQIYSNLHRNLYSVPHP